MSLIELGLANNFYVTGGTLRFDAPCYVQRQADEDLLQALQQGKFCYVLTARQSGKSSLMVQTAARLRATGIGVAILDLTAIGNNLTIEQWYGGLLSLIGQQLDLEDELLDFYARRALLSPLQSWMRAIREIILPRYFERVVIFVDEIDAVHNLPFSTDEFFAGIRNFYNERTTNSELEKLTFCLLGVATPADLVSDARTTPFNVGLRIELNDFSAREAESLARGLARETVAGRTLMQRILYWTNGHPYLTQRLCQQIAPDKTVQAPQDVDRHCENLFLAHRALERDDNLLFVRERIVKTEADLGNLLYLYSQVLKNKRVPDEETNLLVSELRLSGVVNVQNGLLQVRNRIYEQVFTREWIKAHLPNAELARQKRAFWRGVIRATAFASLVILAVSLLAVLAIRQRNEAEAQRQANRRLLYASEMSVVAQAWESANIARVRELLDKQIPADGQEDLRGFEWHYYQRLSQRQQRTLKFSSLVQGVAYAPNGQWLAVGLDDGSVKIVEVTTGHELYNLKGHTDRVYAVSISPNGELLATASFDQTVRFWDVETGSEVSVLRDFKDKVVSAAFSPDGKLLATGEAGGVATVWDVATGKSLAGFAAGAGWVSAVAFSPDGKKLAVVQHKKNVHIFSVRTHIQLQTIEQEASVTSIAFSPDGETLATGCWHTAEAKLWNVRTGKWLKTLRGHKGVVWCVAFSPDGKTLATSGDDSLTLLWEIHSDKPPTRLAGHGSYIFSVAFSPDGKTLATGSWDKTVKLWSVPHVEHDDVLTRHQDWIKAMAFVSDGKILASAAEDGSVKFGDITSRQQLSALKKTPKHLEAAAFAPTGNLIAAASEDHLIKIWDRQTGQELRSLPQQSDQISQLAIAPNAKLLASGDIKGKVKVWDIASGRLLYDLSSYKYYVFSLAFAPDSSQLVLSGGYDKMRVLDAITGKEIYTLQPSSQIGRVVTFSPDGKWIAAESDGTNIVLIDTTTHKVVQELHGHTARLTSFSFTPDSKRLATSSVDGVVKIWEISSGLEFSTIHSPAGKVFAIAFSPDGKTLAAATADKAIHLWNTRE